MSSGFLFIPEHIMENDDLSLQEKIVYGRVLGLTKKEGYCFISNELLGQKLGLSGSMVSKHINSLVKKGLLQIEVTKKKKGEGTPNEWGTRRKIYAYLSNHSNPSTINGEPPSTINGEYSITENRGQGEAGVDKLPLAPPSFSHEYEHFPLDIQLDLLRHALGLYERMDFQSVLTRIMTSKGRKTPIRTAYSWFMKDIKDGKLASNYYLGDEYPDERMPRDFAQVEKNMDLFVARLRKENPKFFEENYVRA